MDLSIHLSPPDNQSLLLKYRLQVDKQYEAEPWQIPLLDQVSADPRVLMTPGDHNEYNVVSQSMRHSLIISYRSQHLQSLNQEDPLRTLHASHKPSLGKRTSLVQYTF